MTINLEKVKVLNLWGFKQIVQRDLWMGGDQNQTKSKLWKPVESIPPRCDSQEMKVDNTDYEKIAYFKQSSETRIRDNVAFIQSKQDHSLVLYPELTLFTKGHEHDSGMWGRSIELWNITQVSCLSDLGMVNPVISIHPLKCLFPFLMSASLK